jgi:hypothetical protein
MTVFWLPGSRRSVPSSKPGHYSPGHKRAGNDDSPKIIEGTRQYIRDFDRVAGKTTTALGLYDKMLELYPDRVNPGERSGFRRARSTRNLTRANNPTSLGEAWGKYHAGNEA